MPPSQSRLKPTRGGGVKYIDYKAKYKVLTMMRDHKALIFGPIYDKQTKAARTKKWKEIFAFAAKLDVVPRSKNYKYIRDVFWQNCKKYSTNKLLNCKKGNICKLTQCDKVSLDILGRGSEAEAFVNDDSQCEGSNDLTDSPDVKQDDDIPIKASGSSTATHDISISTEKEHSPSLANENSASTDPVASPFVKCEIPDNLTSTDPVASASVKEDNQISNNPSVNDTSYVDASPPRKRRVSRASFVKRIFHYLATSNPNFRLPLTQKIKIPTQQTVPLPNIEDVSEGDEDSSGMEVEYDAESNFSAPSINTMPKQEHLSARDRQHHQRLRKPKTMKERLQMQQMRLLNHKIKLEIALMERQLGYPSSKFTKDLGGPTITIKSEADTSITETTASADIEPNTPVCEDTLESENPPEVENPPKILMIPRRVVKLEKITTATQTIESGEPNLSEETAEMPETRPPIGILKVAMCVPPKQEPVDVNENVQVQPESNHNHCYDNHGAYYNNNGEVMYDVRINYGDYEYETE